jgi:hypothetical protein
MQTHLFTEQRKSNSKNSASNLDQILTSSQNGKLGNLLQGNKTILLNSSSTKNVVDISIRKLSGPSNIKQSGNFNTIQSVVSKQV